MDLEKWRILAERTLIYVKSVINLELGNQNLMSQLQKLQNMIRKIAPQQASQTGICLMVMVLCFAVFLEILVTKQL